MDDPSAATTRSRPVAITVVCVLMLVGALITVPTLFTDIPGRVGYWYPPALALSVVVGFVCTVGFWRMQRWAVFSYTIFVGVNQVILLLMGVWNVFALLLPGIVVAVAFAHLSKMR